jgi:hypothetical protein
MPQVELHRGSSIGSSTNTVYLRGLLPAVLRVDVHDGALARISRGRMEQRMKLVGSLADREPYPFPDIWDPLARVFDAWGFERCLWGTDWIRAFAVVNYEQAVEPFRPGRRPRRFALARGDVRCGGSPTSEHRRGQTTDASSARPSSRRQSRGSFGARRFSSSPESRESRASSPGHGVGQPAASARRP